MLRRNSTIRSNSKVLRKPQRSITNLDKKVLKSSSASTLPPLASCLDRINSGSESNLNTIPGVSAQKNLKRMGFSRQSSPKVTFLMGRASVMPNEFIDQFYPNGSESNFPNKVSLPGDWNYNKRLYEDRVRSIIRVEEAKKASEEYQSSKIPSLRRYRFTLACTLQDTLGCVPDLIRGATFVEVGSKIYLYGGKYHGSYFGLSVFNPRMNHWRVLSPTNPPLPRVGHSAVGFRYNLIVFGGMSRNKKNCEKNLQILDVRDLRWTESSGSGCIPCPRRHHAVACFGKFMLMYGGINNQGETLNDLYLLDMEFLLWSEPNFTYSTRPSARSDCTLTAVFPPHTEEANLWCPGKIVKYVRYECGFYLMGGLDAYNDPLNDMWILKFGPEGCWWTSVDNVMPVPKFLHTASFTNHLIVVTGGQPVQNEDDSVRVFNLNKQKWSKTRIIGDFPLCRWEHCAAVHDSKVLVFGGQSDVNFLDRKLQVLETDQMNIKNLIANQGIS